METLKLNPRQEANLLAKIDASGDCWLWVGYLNDRGYGSFRVGERMLRAHRAVYSWLVRDVSDDSLVANHLCKVRNCVNPDHIEFTTQYDNVMYSVSPGSINASKTHCKRGHPLSGDNLYVKPCGRRICRKCKNSEQRIARAPGGSRELWRSK